MRDNRHDIESNADEPSPAQVAVTHGTPDDEPTSATDGHGTTDATSDGTADATKVVRRVPRQASHQEQDVQRTVVMPPAVTTSRPRVQQRKQRDENIGRAIDGRYVIENRVGIGGTAAVYEAHDLNLDRSVAIKLMLPQFASDETFAARFKQEAKSAARLQSSHIVSIYDWGIDDGSYYIVMELLNGTDLKTMITDDGPLPCVLTAGMASQVCAGLQVAHSNGIVHRDIKPQNIMVMPDHTVKIMDFGIAKPANSHLTSTHSVFGTAHYISPEQTRGLAVGPTADIYSLGVSMYECVTKELPFDGNDAVTVALKQVQEIPTPPSEVNPDVDMVMERIILKCMAKDPADRFQTAAELQGVLDDYANGRDVSVGAVPMGSAIPRFDSTGHGSDDEHRKVKVLAAIVASVLVLCVGVAWALGAFTGGHQQQGITSSQVSVPDLSGMSEDGARSAISERGLTVGDVTEEYSDTVTSGKVISQTPDAGSSVDPGSSVDIVVSKGVEPPKTVTVPSLSGETKANAIAKLEQVGLVVSISSGYSDTISAGSVMDQNPAGGTTVQVGSTVTISISQGADMVTVPSVIGMTDAEARDALTSAGLTIGSVTTATSDTVEAGTVISQSVSADTSTKRSTSVGFVVSSGRGTVNVGNLGLVGMTLANAKNKLNANGLSVTVKGSDDLASIVQDVSPTTVEVGGTVTLTTKAPSASGGSASGSDGNAS